MAVAAESSNSVLQALWSQSKQNDMDFWQGIPFPIDSFAVKMGDSHGSWTQVQTGES